MPKTRTLFATIKFDPIFSKTCAVVRLDIENNVVVGVVRIGECERHVDLLPAVGWSVDALANWIHTRDPLWPETQHLLSRDERFIMTFLERGLRRFLSGELDPKPHVGQHVRHIEHDKCGFVVTIADGSMPYRVTLGPGDVEVLSDGYNPLNHSMVTHISHFWDKWEMVQCKECGEDQCVYYTQLVASGLSYSLADRMARAAHTNTKLVVNQDEYTTICKWHRTVDTRPDGELIDESTRCPGIPVVDVVLDLNADTCRI